jgi:hypothetical protein
LTLFGAELTGLDGLGLALLLVSSVPRSGLSILLGSSLLLVLPFLLLLFFLLGRLGLRIVLPLAGLGASRLV